MSSWDAYAPFYDWENARTLGRRDVPFWRSVVVAEGRSVLELGCGTGRLLMPLGRTGVGLTGIDLSEPMLARARARSRRLPRARRPAIVRGDIRALPFPPHVFGVVLASYGMLQSLLVDADLDAALAETARVLQPGGLFGIDLVPDLARWRPHGREVSLRGPSGSGSRITLVEAVRRDRKRGLTIFDEEFIERQGRRERRRRFQLTFRTWSEADIALRLGRAGFHLESTAGDYRGGPRLPGAEVWLILARRGK
jgi:SAM-dependent methyltransferase